LRKKKETKTGRKRKQRSAVLQKHPEGERESDHREPMGIQSLSERALGNREGETRSGADILKNSRYGLRGKTKGSNWPPGNSLIYGAMSRIRKRKTKGTHATVSELNETVRKKKDARKKKTGRGKAAKYSLQNEL